MFSQAEESYVISFINRYFSLGYKYYVVSTINDDLNSVYDMVFYFSENPIVFSHNDSFYINDGIMIYFNSTAPNSYNSSPISRYYVVNPRSRVNW